jgi:general secretion pathway protein I
MMARAAGFTLMEVLVALAIVAFGMAAVLTTMTSAADSTYYLRDRSFAEWVALNRIASVRLTPQLPKPGKTTGEVEFANQRWHWQQEVLPLPTPGMWRIDVSVRPLQIKNTWYTTQIGVMGDAVEQRWDDASRWGGALNPNPNPNPPPNPGESQE